MLPRDPNEFDITPKLKFIYEDFEYITQTDSYRVFEARTRQYPREKHSIRILDPFKDLVAKNFDCAATLFIQELFHLHTRCPGSVLINTLEISEDCKQIACAVSQYSLITPQKQIERSMDLKNPKVIEKLLSDMISDLEFLSRDLKLKNIASIIEPENIYYLKEKGTFFLGNWDKVTKDTTLRPQDLSSSVIGSVKSELRSQDIATEIKALAYALLQMKKVNFAPLELMLQFKEIDISTYETAVKSTVKEGFNDSQELQNLVERMFSLDPRNLPNLEEFKIKEDRIQVPFEKTKNETNIVRKEVGIQVAEEESKINPPYNSVSVNSLLFVTPSTLIAWCSNKNNKISIIDLETKQNYVTFDGARISDTDFSWAYLKEIPNTKLLVSLHHNYQKTANMEIFDISKKGKSE